MKYRILVAAVVIQLCLGGLYAWSAFVPALQGLSGLGTAESQLVFGVLIGVFTAVAVFSGRLAERWGPRRVAVLAALFYGTGYLVASFSGGRFPLLFLGIGLLAGVGTGFGYVCPLGTVIRWFPDHKGLVTGLAVGGFGAGAVVLSTAAEYLLSSGVPLMHLFRGIALVYGAVLLIAALFLRYPDTPVSGRTAPEKPARLPLSDPFFWMLVAGIFSGTFAGLILIGNLKPLVQSSGAGSVVVSVAILLYAAGNTAGRMVWGALTDRWGPRSIGISLGVLAAAHMLLVLLPSSGVGVAVAVLLAGFGFGGCFSVYAVLTASRYGGKHFGLIYPWIFLGYGLAGIAGPWAGGALFEYTADYRQVALAGLAAVTAGLLLVFLISTKIRITGTRQHRLLGRNFQEETDDPKQETSVVGG